MAAEMPSPAAQTCEAYSGVYQSADTFRHLSNGSCENRQSKAQEAKSKRADRKPVPEVLEERRARLREEERHAALVGQIDVREFEFKSVDEVRAMTVSDDGAMYFDYRIFGLLSEKNRFLPEHQNLSKRCLLYYHLSTSATTRH